MQIPTCEPLTAMASVNSISIKGCTLPKASHSLCQLASWSWGKQLTPIWPLTWCKENIIHQTKITSCLAPWSSTDVHMPIVGAFSSGQWSLWAPWLVCSYAALYTTKLWCTAYSDTFLPEPDFYLFIYFWQFQQQLLICCHHIGQPLLCTSAHPFFKSKTDKQGLKQLGTILY